MHITFPFPTLIFYKRIANNQDLERITLNHILFYILHKRDEIDGDINTCGKGEYNGTPFYSRSNADNFDSRAAN